MEFHYLVSYNSDTKKWSVEDETRYLDGNVWDEEEFQRTGYGWGFPEETSKAYLIDERCRTMLETLASIWPEVDHGY